MNRQFTTGQVFAAAGLMAGVVFGTAVLSGCGTRQTPGATSTKTVTVTDHPSVPSSGSTTPAPTPSTSGTTAPASASPPSSGPPACATRDLGAKVGQSQGAAGSIYVDLVFTNISGSTCTLYGYPGVSLAGGSPIAQLGKSAEENPATPREVVTLAPGAVSSALLRIVQAADFPTSRCHPVTAAYLQIYPPNQTTPIYLAYSGTACKSPVNLLTVNVVKPGPDSQ
jgi:hypothetical protein